VRYSERIVPSQTSPGILALHLKRYEFALGWCDGAEVLDAGCGAGYGAAFLAAGALSVVGVDRSSEALAYARANYATPNVSFVLGDVLSLPFADASFDVVCAFETIEHLDDQRAFVREAARVLRPRGTLLASTPRVAATTSAPANPFHRRELSGHDFERLLSESFERVDLYGQRRRQTARHRAVQRLDVAGLRKRVRPPRLTRRVLGTPPTSDVRLDEIEIVRDRLSDASELVAVCADPRRP
jgi:SAM-dependent methyltransferase